MSLSVTRINHSKPYDFSPSDHTQRLPGHLITTQILPLLGTSTISVAQINRKWRDAVLEGVPGLKRETLLFLEVMIKDLDNSNDSAVIEKVNEFLKNQPATGTIYPFTLSPKWLNTLMVYLAKQLVILNDSNALSLLKQYSEKGPLFIRNLYDLVLIYKDHATLTNEPDERAPILHQLVIKLLDLGQIDEGREMAFSIEEIREKSSALYKVAKHYIYAGKNDTALQIAKTTPYEKTRYFALFDAASALLKNDEIKGAIEAIHMLPHTILTPFAFGLFSLHLLLKGYPSEAKELTLKIPEAVKESYEPGDLLIIMNFALLLYTCSLIKSELDDYIEPLVEQLKTILDRYKNY